LSYLSILSRPTIERQTCRNVREGDKVTFDIVPNRGKESTENLREK
jgi:cold shock CspA family protein